MNTNCRKSCGLCRGETWMISYKRTPIIFTDSHETQSVATFENKVKKRLLATCTVLFSQPIAFKASCEKLRQPVEFRSLELKPTSFNVTLLNFHVFIFVVYDKHAECPAWGVMGNCRASNWTWMTDHCPQSCDVPCKLYTPLACTFCIPSIENVGFSTKFSSITIYAS